MKVTVITIYNRDSTVSKKQSFKGDISVIVTTSCVKVTKFNGTKTPEETIINISFGQAVNVRNWGD